MIDSQARAALHPIEHSGPAVNFTSGALLGNGGMGVVVCVRPESILLHFGHNAVWDIRLAENNREAIGTFAEVFEKVDAVGRTGKVEHLIDDPWYDEYSKMCRENYAKPYPRPMPCGTVVLGFDRRRCEPLGWELDISRGVCRVPMLVDGDEVSFETFVDMECDRLWARCIDGNGESCQPFERVRVMPDPQTPKEFPNAVELNDRPSELGFSQILPRVTEPGEQVPGEDHSFRLLAQLPGSALATHSYPAHKAGVRSLSAEMGTLERAITQPTGFDMRVALDHAVGGELPERPPVSDETFSAAASRNADIWRDYWSKSAVALADEKLERYWYHNLYFLRCATAPGVTCPGLFANWSYGSVGSSWHGDYHMNYNTQQPFWVTFSSNHLELNEPYVDLVDHVMPLAKLWARDYYQLRGAYFPHSAYPVEMTLNPYPVPTWGWEVHETPWTVQGLWWHYLYSMDETFLRDRAFGPVREATRFMADYMLRDDARGERFGDDHYHIFPTVAPEIYGLRLNFQFNHDAQTDLTLTRFLFDAFKQACEVLQCETGEAELLADVATILEHFPPLSTAESSDGAVWTAVPGGDPELVHNCPASTMAIFPGEEVGLHSSSEDLAIARRTLAIQHNEGGNELVFLNLQRARVGALDLERFKRQLDYCLMPNGACTNMVLQSKGRYEDTTRFDYMEPMGIWYENFAVPVVINECLMQSFAGIIHLFGNWPMESDATFENFRAVGAFLVSAELKDSRVREVTVHSEAGGLCRMMNPWLGDAVRIVGRDGERILPGDALLEIDTKAGETVKFSSVEANGHGSVA